MNQTQALSQQFTVSIPDLITRYCEPNQKEQGKYQCPICGGGNLQFSNAGDKWNCWNDPSNEHRSDIAKWLNDLWRQDNPENKAPIRSQRRSRREERKQKDVIAAVAASEVEMKVEELVASYDPAFGITKAKLSTEVSAWAKAHGHDGFAAKMLLKERLAATGVIESGTSETVKLARNYHKISDVWGDRLKWNERTSKIELDDEPIDLDIARVNLAIEHNIQCGAEDFFSICTVLARKSSYDPVVDYLQSVASRHKEKSILEGIASRYFGVEGSIYETFVRKTLIAAVARAFNPGCTVQTVLILQGNTGFLKSTWFKTLCGAEFFDDTMGNAADRDERLKLSQFWMVEWAELETIFRRKDISTVKAFITTTADNVRPAYGRHNVTYQRRSILVGTSNEDDFLKDPTGNRRFWVLPVQHKIPIDLLREERDRIWAAAVHCYMEGETWYLTAEDEATAADIAAQYEDYDVWGDFISAWLEMFNPATATTEQILKEVFHFEAGDMDRASQMRVARCMKQLGWDQKMKGKNRHRVWTKKISFLPNEVDHVDLPPLEPSDSKGFRGDQPGDQPQNEVDHPNEVDLPPKNLVQGGDQPLAGGDQPGDQPLKKVDRLPEASDSDGFRGVDQPDQPKSPKKGEIFKKGDRVLIERDGEVIPGEIIRENERMRVSPKSRRLDIAYRVQVGRRTAIVTIDCIQLAGLEMDYGGSRDAE